MAQIKIDVDKLANARTVIQRQEERMLEVSRTLTSIAQEFNMEVAITGELQQRLATLSNESTQAKAKVSDLSVFLDRACTEFSQTDKSIAQQAKGTNYLMASTAYLAQNKGFFSRLIEGPLNALKSLFGLSTSKASTVPMVLSWLGSYAMSAAGDAASSIKKPNIIPPEKTFTECVGPNCIVTNPETPNIIPPEKTFTECVGEYCTVPEPVQYPYTASDAANKKKVADLNSSYYNDGYMKPNASGYKYQCTSYVYCRVREKYGLGALTGANYGKDVAATFKTWTNKSTTVDTDGTRYRLIAGRDGNYKVKAYTGDGGSHIISDSWVSFSRTGNTAGHVVYVESVQVENGEKYVYYSEGGTGYHNSGTDGVLKRLSLDAFLTQKDYTYKGCVTFEKA